MKPIQIADQPRLGFLRTLRITVEGIRYRLFRASVTVAVVAMAVAFLMNVMSEGLLKRSVARNVPRQLAEMRQVHDWAERLTRPGSQERILADLAATSPGDARTQEELALGRFDPGDLDALVLAAREAGQYLAFFDEIGYARRRDLLHDASGTAVFERLSTEDGWAQFESAIQRMQTIRKPDVKALRSFVHERWPELKERVLRIRQGWTEAVAKVTEARDKRSIFEALADPESGFGDAVRAAGFAFDRAVTAPQVADQARRALETRRVDESLERESVQKLLAQRNKVLSSEVNLEMLWSLIGDRKGAEAYLERMKESRIDTAGLTVERLTALAQLRQEEANLARAGKLTADVQGSWGGLGARAGWLLLVSVLVCVIGISNAMLMTVTERFREIATLKCLGALDAFIMGMFVLESCFLGVAGGNVGALVGTLIGLGRMTATFGFRLALSLSIPELLLGMLGAVAAGVVMAAVAAVYPAFRAARLAPMEAMRVE